MCPGLGVKPIRQRANYETSLVRTCERFAYWREAVCDAYVRLGCVSDVSENFDGALEIRRYPSIAISTVGGSQHQVSRRKRDIARSTDNDFLLSLQLRRTSRIEQRGNMAVLQPHDFAIYGSTDPYVLSLTGGFRQLVLQFPKEKLLSRLPDAELLTGLRVDGKSEIGQLVSRNVVGFAEVIESQPSDAQFLIEETLLDLVATALANLRGSRLKLSLPEQHVLLRAKTHIQANLSNIGLDRELIAAEIGISVRRLSEIFALGGETVGEYIRNSRLEQAAAKLVDSRFASQTIGEIAISCGFSNLQHFSKLFRNKFNCTPSQHRSSRQVTRLT